MDYFFFQNFFTVSTVYLICKLIVTEFLILVFINKYNSAGLQKGFDEEQQQRCPFVSRKMKERNN